MTGSFVHVQKAAEVWWICEKDMYSVAILRTSHQGVKAWFPTVSSSLLLETLTARLWALISFVPQVILILKNITISMETLALIGLLMIHAEPTT